MNHRRTQLNSHARPRTARSSDAAPRAPRANASPMEALERRVFLAANGFRPALPPTTLPASTDVADVKAGPMAAAGSDLIDLYRSYRNFKRGGGADADFDHPAFDQFLHKDGKIGVTVRGRGTIEQLTDRLRASNSELIYRNRQWGVIDAYVPIGQLHDLSVAPVVANMNPMWRGRPQQMGSSDNQADFVQKSDLVREQFGLDGSGVGIGVLSDSVDQFRLGLAGSVATGDVPENVNIIADSPFPGTDTFGTATDEGRGMLELIHDIAPGSPLAFATADNGMQAFAQYIRALRAAGMDVIVDDILFPNEPWYQPGVIDLAIRDVVEDGAVYLSSAGNSSPNGGFEGNTNFTKVVRDRFVDFDPSAAADTRMRLNLASGGQFFLQWDQPYNGVVGEAQSDLDVYLYDSTYGRKTHVAADNNIRTGIPMESFFIPPGEWDIQIHLADHVQGQPLPTRFRLISFGEAEIGATEYPTVNRASIAGHNGGENTISVGAVPYFNPSQNEGFSSTGPVTRIFDANGNRLSAPESLLKPDVSGVDNVNTSFFGSNIDDDQLPNFAGTSAAAPNVAAVVALMREAAPDATQDEILAALRETAVPVNGTPSGYDVQGGFGLIDAEAAIQRFITPPTVTIQAVRPDPIVEAIDHIKVVFSQKVLGFDLADVTLTRDNGPNLLTGAQSLQTTDSGQSWLLRGLRTLTDTPGTYRFTVNSAGTGIVNTSVFTQPLASGATETWQRIAFPATPTAPGDLKAKVVGDGVVRLRWTDRSANEDRFIIDRALDENFTSGVQSFDVPANTTVFTDNLSISVGSRVFYRVRAFNNFSLFGDSTNVVEVFLPGPGEIILDNSSSGGVLINGNWSTTPAGSNGVLGDTYLDDLNSGKGTKNVRFTPNITKTGDYYVYARWARATNGATNVPIDVAHGTNGAQRTTVTVNQRSSGGDGWVLLGKYRFEVGRDGFVRFRTDGTNGLVSVDSVRFQPIDGEV